jgi:mRNA interferase MazF
MVTPSIGSVVAVPPFSDLSDSKLRPAIVLAEAGRGDWILCQMTSNSYSDTLAIRVEDEDFAKGSLDKTSYARPGKIFTASETLMVREVGILKADVLRKISNAVVRLFQSNVPI